MSTLIICLFIAALLPYLAKVPMAIAMNKLGGYDNNHPRAQQAKLTGFGARACAGHQNAFESLIIFAPAVLLAIAYLLNVALIRSLLWAAGIISSFSIIYICI
jgi:uncharacterized MAPEG superfamily protein